MGTYGDPPDPWDYVEAAVKHAYSTHDRSGLWTEAAEKAKAIRQMREQKAEAMKAKLEIDASPLQGVKAETVGLPLAQGLPAVQAQGIQACSTEMKQEFQNAPSANHSLVGA